MPLRSRTATISSGDIASTFGNAFLPSILNVVLVNSRSFTAPTLCRPRMASTISCRMRVLVRGAVLALIGFVIAHLHQFVVFNQRGDLVGAQLEIDVRQASEFLQFVMVDIAAFILGKRDLGTQQSGLPRMPSNFLPKDPANPYADYDAAKLKAFLAGYRLPL